MTHAGSRSEHDAFLSAAKSLAEEQEVYLTTGKFGDGRAISGTATAYYRGVANLAADVCDVPRDALGRMDAPQLEAFRRSTLDQALMALLGGDTTRAGSEIESYLSLRSEAMADDDLVLDGRRSVLTPVPIFPHAWAGHPVSIALVARFSAAMSGITDGSWVTIEPVTAAHESGREAAIDTLRRAVPRLSEDVLKCVPAIALYRGDLISGYSTVAPLHIFVNARFFDNTLNAAELIQHECLHQKLTDVSVARDLVRTGYSDHTGPTVEVPWSVGEDRTRHFSAERVMAAFHVYTHQVVLYTGLAAVSVLGETYETVLNRLVLAWARAHHFLLATEREDIRAELGRDGLELAEWLHRSVAQMAQLALPDGRLLGESAGEYSAPHVFDAVT